ncbi:SDH family Clp fold serine proteinase [Mycobacterium szulgai]|uniref:SDH family Clp fold serine proteinase n=1 Tax=Mycobacterium szulgai TaxID=1787 RepID=UPI001FE56B94|nr:ATP-dependent Clp protease proteolytic subunit [Mycobacterium szulgai]
MADLAAYTGRNVILYYSGWLEKQNLISHGLPVDVNDSDKNGFMAVIHKLDRTKGLDLILHTPGGSVAATESLVDYLRAMFKTDIRAIVPQLAMSAGTMIALSAKSVVMGKHSSLGPIDPQIGGLAAHGVVEEFERAKREIAADMSTVAVWQPIIAKYPPAFIGECQKAIAWADKIVSVWLETGMFANEDDSKAAATKVNEELADHALTLSHDRHISAEKASELGIKVEMLEDDDGLQDHVLTVHHASALTISETAAFKIIENHNGVSQISMVNVSVRNP